MNLISKELFISVIIFVSALAIGYVWGYNRNYQHAIEYSSSVQKSVYLNRIDDLLIILNSLTNSEYSGTELAILTSIQKDLDHLKNLSILSEFERHECLLFNQVLDKFSMINYQEHVEEYSHLSTLLSDLRCES